MRSLLGSLFAIGVAAVAAIAATTAFLDAPMRIGPATAASSPDTAPPPSSAPGPAPAAGGPSTTAAGKPAAPGGAADAPKGAAGAPTDAKDKEDEGDKDPYEGIAPEDLPPDLQYSADSSVSFPTNI